MIDVQATAGDFRFSIEAVGLTNLKYPLQVQDAATNETQSVAGDWNLAVSLASERRGTHMSRFIAELHERTQRPLGLDDLQAFAQDLSQRLDASTAMIKVQFPWFRLVAAPVSQRAALIDCRVGFHVQHTPQGGEKSLFISVPAKALCPCSKAISDRGAHNQRSDITATLNVRLQAVSPSINHVVRLLESSASSPVYPLLKREDEKYITEYAYDHPVFVEDLVRQAASRLCELDSVHGFVVEAINRESIHAHDCYARIAYTHPK